MAADELICDGTNYLRETCMGSILIIEHTEAVRVLFRTILEQAGYTVVEASNGNEGIRLFHEAPTDVVITDMYMPYPDGLEVIRKLRAHFPALKILAVSGTDGPGGMLTAAKAMGADEILPKPLGVEELLTGVSNLCGRAPSRASSP